MNNYPNYNNYYQPRANMQTPTSPSQFNNQEQFFNQFPNFQGNTQQPNNYTQPTPNTPVIPQTPNVNNNNNFNSCAYVQHNLQPNDLYDPYAGFIRGNMFPDLYDQYKVQKPFEVEPMNDQAQLLTYVDALSFATHDLNLYLDNHPEDQTMIQLFNQYREESKKAVQQYEMMYGPLFVDSNALKNTPWAWNELPWPWENK